MSRLRTFLLLSAALAVGACSDSQSPSAPSDPSAGDALTLQLDESAGPAAAADEAGIDKTGGLLLGTAGKGKGQDVSAQLVSCVHNRYHQICVDIRGGVLRAARADAIVTTSKNRTNSQLKLDGVIIRKSGKFGPNFVGDELFANYSGLNFRLFRGDRICHQFPGVTPQICAVVR